jgi:solute carrier family 8 (sodium/calcium exchanger)
MMVPPIYFGGDTDDPASFYPSAVVYLALITWAFSAVAIVSDVFMTSIEVITSAEKILIVTDEITGKKKKYRAKVWNDTIANLTLMALGSSAPEIMLSLIELLNNELFAGMLGPNTIVGSAAFNFFMISAVCISCLPDGEIRLIEGTKVYACTCSFSLFAYIWLYIVLGVLTPNKVEVVEAVLTFAFFPILVGLAYAFDTEMCFPKQRAREEKVIYAAEAATGKTVHRHSVMRNSIVNEETVNKIRDLLKAKADEAEDETGIPGMSPETIQSVRQQLRAEMGTNLDTVTEDSLMRLLIANVEAEKAGPKSRAHYRVAATRSAFGSKKVKSVEEKVNDTVAKIEDAGPDTKEAHKQPTVEFVTDRYSCLEGCGTLSVRVIRSDNSMTFPASVKYATKGTPSAQPGKDFVEAEGTLEFAVDEPFKDITISIIDNDIVEDDKVFHVELSEPRCTTGESTMILGECKSCAVTIIDDDDPGALDFPEPIFTFTEGVDAEAVLHVVRRKGGSGKVWCDFETEEILQDDCAEGQEPAEHEKNFELKTDKLEFLHNQSSGTIKIPLVDSGSQDKLYKFRVVLKNPDGEPNPCRMDLNTTGLARSKGTMNLDHCTCEVVVQSDPEMKKRNEALLQGAKAEDDKLGGSDYKEQFVAALYCGGSKEEQKESSWGDFISHLIVLPWKVLFAFCPPAEWGAGYPCFIASLGMIGFVTAFVGDLAAHLGCSIGISDGLTAITVVALGTSLPDTFASKQAAMEDPYADASVGNVTGSNSVNVFLGLGLPWTLGAIYWEYVIGGPNEEWLNRPISLSSDETYSSYLSVYPNGGFMVPAGDLGFSVAVYSALAVVAVFLFIIRRKAYGGELGGPKLHCYLSSFLFAILWVAYIVLSAVGPSVLFG